MSYYCRYKTIMVWATPNMVFEITRDGCNNDDGGRTDNDWGWHLWKIDDLLADIQHEKDISTDDYGCKVLGKMKSYRELAEHRERMLSRALSWEEFKRRYSWSFNARRGIEVLSPAEKTGTYTAGQLDEKPYGFLDGCKYRVLGGSLKEKDDIVKYLWGIETGIKHYSDGQYVYKRTWVK